MKPKYRHARERGEDAGVADARRHKADPDNFERTPNPYGLDSEPERHESFEDGWESTFEANRGRS